jgi:thiol-disulfide isomerase/thioredoxin
MAFHFKHPALPYLLVLGGAILIFIWARSANKSGLSFEGFNDSASPVDYILRMYYADWCPHCVAAKPEFNKLEHIQTVHGKKVKCEMINAETEPDKIIEKVTGYPTIRLYDAKNGLLEEHGGARTYDGLMGFLESFIKK